MLYLELGCFFKEKDLFLKLIFSPHSVTTISQNTGLLKQLFARWSAGEPVGWRRRYVIGARHAGWGKIIDPQIAQMVCVVEFGGCSLES